jgi:hypothetical protein
MMGRQDRDQGQLFYEFNLDEMVPKEYLLRRINVFVTGVLSHVHQQLKPFYSDIGRPSVDPELMIRMHPTRAPAVRGGQAAPCLPMFLQARSRRQGPAPLHIFDQSS